jgi:hypothetical protein
LQNVTVLTVSTVVEDRVIAESEIKSSRHLEDVLQSKCFERATTLRALLLYLWQNRDKEISEYAIAVEALGRHEDFESRIDATVRVQISRLRRLLTKYYELECPQPTTKLVIPLGTHQIQLIEAVPEENQERDAGNNTEVESTSAFSPLPMVQTGAQRFLVPLLVAVILVLLACVGWLLHSSFHRESRNEAQRRQELPLFWKQFMDNGKPTRLVLPTPVFFSWQPPGKSGALMVRDISVNDFDKSEGSAQITEIEKRLGKPRPWHNYTVASDTFASLRLARFLDGYGVGTSISSSTESPGEIIEHENVVAFGTTSSLTAYESYLDRLSYKLGSHESYIIDKRQPGAGQIQFPALEESASRTVVPGLIALLPRGTSGSRILLVQGGQTTALISWLTSEEGMQEITQAQASHGHNLYFEAVVLSEVNEGNPIQSRLVAYRPFIAQDSPAEAVNEALANPKLAQHFPDAPAAH